MALNVTLRFPDSPDASAALGEGAIVRRYEMREALSELFELSVELLCDDPALPERAFIGQAVVVTFGDEPFVKEVRGIVRRREQRTAVPGGSSLYVWTVVPLVWLTTRRRDHRIFQGKTVPEIVQAVLADPTYAGRIPPPVKLLGDHPVLEYVVQYDETDWAFLCRILADAGIASFFDHASGSAWTLVDDTTAKAPDLTYGAIPFVDASGMAAAVVADEHIPHILTAAITSQVETSAVTLRDYDFEKPDFILQTRTATGAVFSHEGKLEAYTFEVGHFATEPRGEARARRVLEGYRATRRRVVCSASFSLPPGTQLALANHPRDDLNTSFLVVRGRTVMEGDGRGAHELELMDLGTPFRPARLPKPRIAGTQTAFVVGAEGEEIDVDKHGRVLVEFRWDRRDRHRGATSRRVRVAQGWAGADRGFVSLPRVKDEVVIAYLDGDPDQPLVVGRVHNAASTSPLNLPAEKALTIWRSASTPGTGGRNEVLMDDTAGAERLELRAERDYRSHTSNDSSTHVGNDAAMTVDGDHTTTVKGSHQGTVGGGSKTGVGGDYHLKAKTIELEAETVTHSADDLAELKGANVALLTGGASVVLRGSDVMVKGDCITINAKTLIRLQVGGSSIQIIDGDIRVEAGLIRLNP